MLAPCNLSPSPLSARSDTGTRSSPALLLVIALAAAAHLAPLAQCDGPNPNPEIGNTGGLSLCLVAVPSFGVKLP
ncbi:beta-glucosidase [Hordeum vulgare]|nr:beta-glucosidase [Hordeum vulgare]